MLDDRTIRGTPKAEVLKTYPDAKCSYFPGLNSYIVETGEDPQLIGEGGSAWAAWREVEGRIYWGIRHSPEPFPSSTSRCNEMTDRLEVHLTGGKVLIYNTHSYRVVGDVTIVYPHCNPDWATSRFKSVDILKIVINDEKV